VTVAVAAPAVTVMVNQIWGEAETVSEECLAKQLHKVGKRVK
jgi:hypothetical protein